MEYANETIIAGDPGKAFDHAATVLSTHGFKIGERTGDSIEFTGPGMNSTKQNPLVGATFIRIDYDQQLLILQADLGGVRFMRKFLHVFPAAMALGFGILFGVVMGFVFGNRFGVGFGMPFARGWRWLAFVVPLATLPLVPWQFLSPWMSRSIRIRTEKALDTLLANIAATSS